MARPFMVLPTRASWPARYAAGATLRQIAEADGVSTSVVRLDMLRAGVPRRQSGTRRAVRPPPAPVDPPLEYPVEPMDGYLGVGF